MKKILISCCKECPYKSLKWSENVAQRKYNACSNYPIDYKTIRVLNSIPDWCPLENDK